MKKLTLLLLAAVWGACALSSCNKIPVNPPAGNQPCGTARLTISLSGIDANIETRGSSTAENAGDKTASSLQIIICDSEGNRIKALEEEGTVTLSKGMVYTVVAIVNGPGVSSGVYEARRTVANLATNPFVMYGESTVDLTSSDEETLAVQVKSLASRIYLTGIKNGLPPAFGGFTLKKVYLCNVMGAVKLDGTKVATWYNQYGRKDLATPITPNSVTGAVDETTPAASRTLATYNDQGFSIGANFLAKKYFYTFPNTCRTPVPDNLASLTTWTDQATWLTICGSVQGKIYYWTANIGAGLAGGLQRNTSYDVAIVLKNLGSSDPGTPVTEGSADISVNILPWTAGEEITETI